MDDGSFLHMNLKMTPKWARYPSIKILGPPYNWENIQGELQGY